MGEKNYKLLLWFSLARHRMKSNFRNMKLSGKMVLIYLIVAGASCAISMIGLQASFDIYDKKLYEKSLQEALREAMETKYLSQEYYYRIMPIRKIFLDELNILPVVKNAMYTDRRNVRISVGTDCGTVSEETYAKLFSMCEEARGADVVLPPSSEFPYQLSGRDILETQNARLTYLGTVIVTSDISQMIEKKKKELKYADSFLYVYSGDGMIYGNGETLPKLPQMDENQGYKIVHYQNEQYFMSYLKAEKNGWMYVNYVPYREIFGQMQILRYGMLGGLVAVFLATLYVLIKVSNIITSPLHHLTEAMYLVERGDFQEAKEFLKVEDRSDEAGLLTQEFQIMLEKIDSLIHENYEKQLLLMDTRYQMLQAQINPHFMSNTLNAVNWMIKAGENRDASKMIVELGNLLQAAFSRELYTTVEREMETAESYITIQQFRYRSRIVFTVEKQGSLKEYIVPCMILQPLIENAIYYGADRSLSVCNIFVSAREDERGMLLSVRDEGAGMSPDELEAVRNGTLKPKGHGIGLKNIRERLRMAYADSEFVIESKPGVGTQITICIPRIACDGMAGDGGDGEDGRV